MRKIIIFLVAMGFAFHAMAAERSLETVLQESTALVLNEISNFRGGSVKDDELYDNVDRILDDLVDFQKISQGVMGGYYRNATPEQRSAFEARFRTSIVGLFSKTLVQIESESIDIVPLATPPDQKATVTMDVTAKGGEVYQLIYSMAKGSDGWRVRNILINGINLGMVYRNQFTFAMRGHDNDIERVIEDWNAEVATAE